jgi:hypothetical protein
LHFRCNLNCSKLKAMNEKVIWKYWYTDNDRQLHKFLFKSSSLQLYNTRQRIQTYQVNCFYLWTKVT